MFNPSSIVIDHFVDVLVDYYLDMFGEDEADLHLIVSNARNALEIIANSDAPYHDVNHTVLVTIVGMEILRGKMLIEGDVTARDWIHFVVSLLNHDIGYVRGICRADRRGRYTINDRMETIAPPPGATDAFLTPYHVDRARLYISERFANDQRLDVDTLLRNIERTRFPIPVEQDTHESADYPGLIRAADLIGQLADPQYFRRIAALFAEFKETGQAEKLNYESAADLRAEYPKFFWEGVAPFIEPSLHYLRRTQEGQLWIANLYANVFAEEHETPAYGPERRTNRERRLAINSIFRVSELKSNDKRKIKRRVTD